ncbi:MAG: SDR family NAD(P)-dependent oxidoreductase [Chloroflexi bacterium]|nr:SDR family NAD(P)-dependent oxidoreductase [Chloroflexota bacterium]MCY3938034.1 SDR family NAD(P)-dependent oxidoreductase [Chloroflexota bacterium]
MNRFDGKRVIVTGATRGLGRIMAERFAGEGASVAVTGRRKRDVEQAVCDIREGGGRAAGLAADLSNVDEAVEFIDWAIDDLGGVDILVNNAGGSTPSPFLEVSVEDVDFQFNVMFKSPYVMTQRAVRWMVENGAHGSVIFISTVGATAVHPDRNVYDSLKRGLECLTTCLGAELGPQGIRVNGVAPGAIPIRPGDTPETWGRFDQITPIRRWGNADDIASATLFLASEEAGYICGQTLLVDGGLAGRMPMPRGWVSPYVDPERGT